MHKELGRERAEVAHLVRQEFQRQADPNSNFQRALAERHGGEEVVYGGQLSSMPQELDLVQAWRPDSRGDWQLGIGVVHRVHEDDHVTVQFIPDQHRRRVPFMSVKKINDITPVYPKVRLAPGERLPGREELLRREQERHDQKQALGIAPHQLLPGEEDPNSLRVGETLNEHGHVVVQENRWGIPAPTVEALRNYSIPGLQIGSEYGPHFYTKLYSNNFYAQAPRFVTVAEDPDERRKSNTNIVSHRYIPLEGPELEQDLRTGAWREARAQEPESKGWLSLLLE